MHLSGSPSELHQSHDVMPSKIYNNKACEKGERERGRERERGKGLGRVTCACVFDRPDSHDTYTLS